MVTRKSVAAKVATGTPAAKRSAKGATTAKPVSAPVDGARRSPQKSTATRTATGKPAVKPTGKTAAGKTAKAPAKSSGVGAARKASVSKAGKVDQVDRGGKTGPVVAKKAVSKTPVKTPRKASAKPDASRVATTRRVIAKRDGETRIVTPEIERLDHEVVEQAVTGVVPLPVAPGATRPDFWDQACADLMKRDRILKKLIPQFGPAHLTGRGEPFVTLARSIVGQQISVKAAQAVWDRVVAICPKLSPSQFIKAGHDALAGCGLSRRKAEYILDLATHFKSGALHVDAWATMDDEAVIAELTGIRGIGRWTAEMFLMFNLMRPDVLPLDDVGLINAISVNYFSGEPVTRSEAREVAANWEPWRSVATWYMWRSLEPVPVEY
ncbi:endonuclease III domain-containing protein [Pandoraea sputorum]|uniref:DNA-3-methyladenine glycosylase II n=1 Tax=Pandoraea sputorum TaxID=93222 RepID=A0A5E5B9R3_9BURK|nr:endonuclease III domain-containing protein [Pandoraea sputorum]VVE81967.1 endonuclease III domain-containing protein [Pandoraea sputorum]